MHHRTHSLKQKRKAQGDSVNAKRFLLLAVLASGLAAAAHGQISCPQPSTTVTTHANLVCILPLTSANLQNVTTGPNAAKFQSSLVTPFNAAFASQLTQLPVPTGTAGTTLLKDKNEQAGYPFYNLGPILTDRPETIGKGHIYGGFSFQHFDFDKIDNQNLSSFNVGYTYQQPSDSDPKDQQIFVIPFTNQVSFQMDQYVALVTLGATQRTDITVIVPFNTISVQASSKAQRFYEYDSSQEQWSATDPDPGKSTQSNSGSASGIGDVTVGFKQMLHGTRDEGTPTAISVGAAFRFPTGDPLNYLGSGAYGVNAYGIFSYRSGKSRISPHLKLSYQWNSRSVLVNPSTTTHTNTRLPGGSQYDGGADVRIFHSLTFAADLFGSQFNNTPTYSLGALDPTTLPSVATTVPTYKSLSVADAKISSFPNSTYTTANLSTGFKWQPKGGLLLIGNVMIPVNNSGLHSNPVPLFGIAYNLNMLRNK